MRSRRELPSSIRFDLVTRDVVLENAHRLLLAHLPIPPSAIYFEPKVKSIFRLGHAMRNFKIWNSKNYPAEGTRSEDTGRSENSNASELI